MSTATFKVVIAIFPGVTHLDFTGPHQFFARIPNVDLQVASLGGETIEADGLHFSNLSRLETIADCHLLCVPGGFGVTDIILNEDFLTNIKRLGQNANYVCSVCTGSIILAAAGLLDGKNAACHWAWREVLAKFPKVSVKNERVVRDGNVFTGGGVTAGIDMALTVIAEIENTIFAQGIQLGLEYDPKPPFSGGSKESSSPDLVDTLNKRYESVLRDKSAQVDHFLSQH